MFRVLRSGLLLVPCFSILLCSGQSVESKQSSVSLHEGFAFAVQSTAGAAASADQTAVLSSAILQPGVNAKKILSEALSLYRVGKVTAAIERYRLVLEANPTSPEAHAGLARMYLKQGNVNLAAQTVANGLNVSNSPELRVALGEVYFRQGKIPEAEREWLDVLNSGTGNARAYLGLSRVRNAASLSGQSKAMIDKARELNAVDPDIELNWNMTLPLEERIQRLEGYLSSAEHAGGADRTSAQHYLDYLEMLGGLPQGVCRPVKPIDRAEVPLVRLMIDSAHLRGYGVATILNGRKSTLMLDTGSSGILIGRKVAERAGIKKIAQSRVGGVGDGGEQSGYTGLASSIKIGDLELQDCPVRVLDQRSVVEDEGVIGTDIFEDFLVNIDFPGEKLRISSLPSLPDENFSQAPVAATAELRDHHIAPDMRAYTRAYRFGHYLLVPTRVGTLAPKLFLLDTGGFTNQIAPAAAREFAKLGKDSDKIVIGIDGAVRNVYSAGKAMLRFGGLRQEDQNLMAFDLTSASESIGTEISGILGFATLQKLNIKIDYRDGLVDFEARR